MYLVRVITGLLASSAHAAGNIEQIGVGAPGVAEMWGMLKTVFPHTDVGTGGVAFISLMIINFILRFIGGLATVMLIYGGIRLVIGNNEGLEEAKKIVMYSILGLIAAICADAIVIYAMTVLSEAASG